MQNIKQIINLRRTIKQRIFQLFLLSILLTIVEVKILAAPVQAKRTILYFVNTESNKLVATTATYEDSGNPDVKINATSNDPSNKDLTINNNDLLSEDDLLEIDIFLMNSLWEIFLELDLSR